MEITVHKVSELIAAHKFYSEKLKAVESETISEYQLRTCDCGISQREFDSLKAEEINALQSKIDALEYHIDRFANKVVDEANYLKMVEHNLIGEEIETRKRLARGEGVKI